MSFFGVASGITKLSAQPLVVAFDAGAYDQVFETFDEPAQIGINLEYNSGIIYQSESLSFPGFQIGTFYTGDGFDQDDYEFMWDQQGPFAPNLGFTQINVWVAGLGGGGGLEWQYETSPTAGPPEIADGILRIRRASDMVEISTATNTMQCRNP